MSVKFKVLERRNPSDMDLPAKYYAKAVTHEVIGIDELCELIAEQSTVSETDVLAVLNSLEKNVIRQIKKGNLIQLGRLGSFQLSLNSAGSEQEEQVTAANVLRKRIIFRPSQRFKDVLATLKFKKVA
jgi:predicted histone-like DNA-binding protein